MMDLFYNRVEFTNLKVDTRDAKMRKATSLMKMLVQALEPLFQQEGEPVHDVQLFLSSKHGEIEPTIDFLKSYAQRNWARPFLFQNSLHHSTTGFATQKFHLLGPAYSLCAIDNAQEEVLQAGLLEALSNHKNTLFIHGESFSKELAEVTEYEHQSFCEVLYVAGDLVKNFTLSSKNDSTMVIPSFKDFYECLSHNQTTGALQFGEFLTIQAR